MYEWCPFRWSAVFGLLLIASSLLGCGPSKAQLERVDNEAEYHYNMAYGFYFSPNSPNADAALQGVLHALSLKPDYPEAHMLAGLVYLGREQHLDAISHFDRAVALKPDYRAARNNLGAAYLAAERWADAANVFESLIADRFYATPAHGHNNLGWARYNLGQLAEAQRHFRRAIKIAPELCPAYNNLGLTLVDLGDMEGAARMLDRAVRRCPKYAEPYYHLGRVESRRANLMAARDRFTRCRDLAGDAPLGDRCAKRLTTLMGSGRVPAPGEGRR